MNIVEWNQINLISISIIDLHCRSFTAYKICQKIGYKLHSIFLSSSEYTSWGYLAKKIDRPRPWWRPFYYDFQRYWYGPEKNCQIYWHLAYVFWPLKGFLDRLIYRNHGLWNFQDTTSHSLIVFLVTTILVYSTIHQYVHGVQSTYKSWCLTRIIHLHFLNSVYLLYNVW